MKCRVGDLCVVTNDLEEPANNGRFVTIVGVADRCQYTVAVDWECVAATVVYLEGEWASRDFAYRDAELTPIRDPGEDATDEMVQLLGSPSAVPA